MRRKTIYLYNEIIIKTFYYLFMKNLFYRNYIINVECWRKLFT